jgi:hypothetical protein
LLAELSLPLTLPLFLPLFLSQAARLQFLALPPPVLS